jgi:hypothetical protein
VPADIDGARATLRRYLKDGQIKLTPEPLGDAQAYTARAEFLPLGMLTDKAETPSQIPLGGSCPRLVARGRFVRCTTSFRCKFALRWPHDGRSLGVGPGGSSAGHPSERLQDHRPKQGRVRLYRGSSSRGSSSSRAILLHQACTSSLEI